MKTFLQDFSITACMAGILAVVVSYAGPAVILFQAAHQAGFSNELIASWIWAISLGSGITAIFLSWRLKMPIITAWSTPGAALLVVMLPGVPLAEAVGAYMASAVIITLIGITGSLDLLMRRIPTAVTSGMFAGILFSFGAKVFTSIQLNPLLSLSMIGAFILIKRLWPRYSVAAVMLIGMTISVMTGLMHIEHLPLSLAKPIFTMPSWSGATILSIGMPLALVTLTGQYIPGMAVLHASGYQVRSDGIMTITGLCSLLLAPFGSHAVNLSSLTAAICTGKESHENPNRRYVAGIACGCVYILIGLFGTTLTTLFAALPPVFVAVLAGLALISAFTAGFVGIFRDNSNIESGIVAFLATASGMEFLGFGSPFWGLVLGTIAFLAWQKKPPVAQTK